jgi:hypothetical protein
MLHCHDFISSDLESFALWMITMVNSLLKVATRLSIDGSSPLKSQAFLSFHMHQHIIIMMSMVKETPKAR